MMKNEYVLTGEFEAFSREWADSEPYVTAHTSGSTGTPKEVRLAKADMLQSARSTVDFFGLGADSSLVCPLSAGYIAGKMMLVRAEVCGGRLVTIAPSNRPFDALQPCPERIDLMCVVPSQVENLLESPVAASSLVNLIVGGAPLSPELERRLASAPWRSYATYGMTETCSHVALRRIGETEYHALPGISFTTDASECLAVHTEAFGFGSLQTRDVVRVLSSTSFEWLGRADFVINSGGVKLHPELLERQLAPFLDCRFFICGTPHPKWGEAVHLVIEGTPEKLPEENVIEVCRRVLPRYAAPYRISYVDALPLTCGGKLDRRFYSRTMSN
jgi:O-succinylbenzoic acid--coA ligase